MADLLDAPNQQVVRPDGSAPWDEGEGGSQHEPEAKPKGKAKTKPETDTKDDE